MCPERLLHNLFAQSVIPPSHSVDNVKIVDLEAELKILIAIFLHCLVTAAAIRSTDTPQIYTPNYNANNETVIRLPPDK